MLPALCHTVLGFVVKMGCMVHALDSLALCAGTRAGLFFNITGHGKSAGAFVVVPCECDATEQLTTPVSRD